MIPFGEGSRNKPAWNRSSFQYVLIDVRKMRWHVLYSYISAPEAAEKQATLTPLKNVTVKEGQAAQFKTEVSGSPFPTIQWFREGALIPQSKDFQVLSSSLRKNNCGLMSRRLIWWKSSHLLWVPVAVESCFAFLHIGFYLNLLAWLKEINP